ncbi:molybdopterin-dependent oxidoreductase [Nonomuraea sp. NBC_01738]|uniref:molybdopterin-dependent oxidoreductase n=1 Tax=Nonomuraea sp. NBC_01738 TaxID=2976003 RepID=UPI002E0F2D85|nr:molybdopterin-dependent oxidoreductase [Nonomuraea sp. NBC_01738]
MRDVSRRVPAWAGALAGLVSGAVALGISQLVAALVKPSSFPVLAVGDAVVDASPPAVKDFAIATFGENDKTALVIGVVVVLGLVAAALGVLARHRLWYGQAGLAVFAAVGVWAVLTRPDAGPADALPTLVGVAAAMLTLPWLLRRATADKAVEPAPAPAADGQPVESPQVRANGLDRRGLLTGVAGGAVVAGVSTVLGRSLAGQSSVDTARSRVALPSPAVPAKPLPAGVDLGIRGLSPFITPNDAFYRVDTALLLPKIDPADWVLRIHGMVDRPIVITYADLLKRPLTEATVTLTCVSNEVGGDLAGNARWLGVRLADVLREAGLKSGADMLLSTSDDGWTCGTPVDVVMDGRDALLAVAMNGAPLPVAHGFPVRQVVPGLYGYVSATKWIVDLKATRFDQDEAYWTPRGWSAKGPIKTQSRIDLPRSGATVKPGTVTVAGVAWAQHTGIDAVEVRVDQGPWQRAKLAEVPGPDTWRQWSYDWQATPGDHTLQVRATDAAGRTQTEEQAPPAPDGATGWHTVTVSVA